MLRNWEGVVNTDSSPLKMGKGATSSGKERAKEKWADQFENSLNQNRVTRKDIEENEEVCDTLDVKEGFFLFRISDSTERIKKS